MWISIHEFTSRYSAEGIDHSQRGPQSGTRIAGRHAAQGKQLVEAEGRDSVGHADAEDCRSRDERARHRQNEERVDREFRIVLINIKRDVHIFFNA